MTRKRFCLLFEALLVSLIGCGAPTIISSLQRVAALATASIDVLLPAMQVPLPLAEKIRRYLAAVNQAIATAASILQGGTLTAAQLAEIVSSFTLAVLPNLHGASGPVVSILEALAAAVAAFLRQVKPVHRAMVAGGGAPRRVPLDRHDRERLGNVVQAARENAQRLEEFKEK